MEKQSVLGCIMPDVKLSELTTRDWRRLSLLIDSSILVLLTEGYHLGASTTSTELTNDGITENGVKVVLRLGGDSDRRIIGRQDELRCPSSGCGKWVKPEDYYSHIESHNIAV